MGSRELLGKWMWRMCRSTGQDLWGDMMSVYLAQLHMRRVGCMLRRARWWHVELLRRMWLVLGCELMLQWDMSLEWREMWGLELL